MEVLNTESAKKEVTSTPKIASLKLLVAASCSSFVLGAILSSMATTIYFLSSSAKLASPFSTANESLKVPSTSIEAEASKNGEAIVNQASWSNPPTSILPLPVEAAPQNEAAGLMNLLSSNQPSGIPPLKESKEGLSGGGFFLGNKVVPYTIPLEQNADAVAAKKILLSKVEKMLSITVGSGKNHMYIIFDPICPICHQTWALQDAEQWAATYDMTIHWIPANYFFQQKQSAIASIYILSLLVNNKQSEAFEFINNMNRNTKNRPTPIQNQEMIIEEVVDHLNAGTMAMIQTGQRLPAVLIPSAKSSEITAITGIVEGFEIKEALQK